MNASEFTQWVKYHSDLFSGFAKWFDNLADGAIQVWREGFASIDLGDATQASKDMALGVADMPQGYSKHLITVTRRARTIARERREQAAPRRQYVEGQTAYNCGECLDSGLVLIYRPEFVAAVMAAPEGEEIEDSPSFCNVACSCGGGAQFKSLTEFEPNVLVRWKRRNASRIVEAPMVLCTVFSRQQMLEECQAGVHEFQDGQRVSAFDAWNEGVSE